MKQKIDLSKTESRHILRRFIIAMAIGLVYIILDPILGISDQIMPAVFASLGWVQPDNPDDQFIVFVFTNIVVLLLFAPLSGFAIEALIYRRSPPP